jgi:5-methylcytosine-specific restriction endonuclease McrA
MGQKSTARQAWRRARVENDPRCDYCGVETREDVHECHPRRATVDDIRPRSKGGANNQSNWALACYLCNKIKGDEYPTDHRPHWRGRKAQIMRRAFGVAIANREHQERRAEVDRLAQQARAMLRG